MNGPSERCNSRLKEDGDQCHGSWRQKVMTFDVGILAYTDLFQSNWLLIVKTKSTPRGVDV
jgi:hypothetical protein